MAGTENALEQMKKFGVDFLLQTLSPAPPEDAALAIVKGGATRQREIYFPYLEARLSTLARDWAIVPLEAFLRYLWARP